MAPADPPRPLPLPLAISSSGLISAGSCLVRLVSLEGTRGKAGAADIRDARSALGPVGIGLLGIGSGNWDCSKGLDVPARGPVGMAESLICLAGGGLAGCGAVRLRVLRRSDQAPL